MLTHHSTIRLYRMPAFQAEQESKGKQKKRYVRTYRGDRGLHADINESYGAVYAGCGLFGVLIHVLFVLFPCLAIKTPFLAHISIFDR